MAPTRPPESSAGSHVTPAITSISPTSASWLNQVERWFNDLTQKRIRRGSLDSLRSLEEAIRQYLDQSNQEPKPFVWTANADLILRKVQRLCERIYDSTQ